MRRAERAGRDARRRKQYLYHERWREVRDETKYDRMVGFAFGGLAGADAPEWVAPSAASHGAMWIMFTHSTASAAAI